tara:strand:- start:999 stop:1682 length:684 start_codon:yes stop_codon:yes gene_type:complete
MSDVRESVTAQHYLVRFGGEAALIVVSVFVAIFLESMWQDRVAALEARESLAQVRQSLAEDLAFLDKVEAEQKDAEEMINLLIRWAANPELLTNEQVQDIVLNYATPISIWPRRAAWDSMVAAGQLRLLRAPDLTTLVGDYYEYHLRRVEYNGRQYDEMFVAVFDEDLSRLWNYGEARLLAKDPADLAYFRNRLILLKGWTLYYLDYVQRIRELLVDLIEEIDEFLG